MDENAANARRRNIPCSSATAMTYRQIRAVVLPLTLLLAISVIALFRIPALSLDGPNVDIVQVTQVNLMVLIARVGCSFAFLGSALLFTLLYLRRHQAA